MKKLLSVIETVILLFVFSFFLSVPEVAQAANAINQSTKIGSVDTIKCADGLKCENVKGDLKLSAYHNWTVVTFASGDATPSVASGTIFNTYSASQTITMFDDGVAGKEIEVYSKGATTFDVTGTHLKCGSTDIVSASGDFSSWLFDGTDWQCKSFIDATDNLN